MKGLFGTILLCLLCGSWQTVRAQSYDYSTLVIDNSMATAQLSQSIFNSMMAGEMTREALESSSGRSTSSRPAGRGRRTTTPGTSNSRGGSTPRPTGGTAGTTTFRASASFMPQRLAAQIAKAPADQTKLEHLFNDMLESFKDRARQRGGEVHDVARAASFLLSESYYVYSGGRALSGDEFAGLMNQLQRFFSSNAAFQRRSDRERQQMFESFAITGAFLGTGYDLMKQRGDNQTLRDLHQLAQRSIEGMLGTSPEQIRFTANGIEFR